MARTAIKKGDSFIKFCLTQSLCLTGGNKAWKG